MKTHKLIKNSGVLLVVLLITSVCHGQFFLSGGYQGGGHGSGGDEIVPANLIVQNITIYTGQTECYNATNTITIAGSGTTVDILSGGEATFIAGEKIIINTGFKAHEGSYCNAYITTTGEYCSSLPPMVSSPATISAIPEIFIDNDPDVRIYPNPTSGHATIDFMGKETTTDIMVLNFQGKKVFQTECNNQIKAHINISHLPGGMYIVVIRSHTQVVTKKIIKVF